MQSISNKDAPTIIASVTRAHHLPSLFREGTFHHGGQLCFTIQGFDADRRRVHFSACKGYRPTTHHTRFIRTDKDGECFTFAGVTYHAWMFETGEERAAIAADFYAHYRIIDSPVPDVRQTERPSVRGQARENRLKLADMVDWRRHDQTILDNINATVREDDELYVLGDLSAGGRASLTAALHTLEGLRVPRDRRHLILGNHEDLQGGYSQMRQLLGVFATVDTA